jgi:hypothetical protein
VISNTTSWDEEYEVSVPVSLSIMPHFARINQLQAVFDQPPRYGKDFDWTGYSVHDAASVLRRQTLLAAG